MTDSELVDGAIEAEAQAKAKAQAPHKEVAVIDSRRDYLAAVEAIAAGVGPVAVDTERASGFRYSQRAYLIQVFRRNSGTFLFDPPAIGNFQELNDAVAEAEWVLHAASQDLACLREVGLHPRRIFDTELGSRLAGMARVGLGTVVEELLGVHLAKEHSAADWSTRPLPQPWLVYAALDVELLVDVRDAVAALLDDSEKSEIARQEFEATLDKPAKPIDPEAWRRLSGLHAIRKPQNLAIARALWFARDAYAQEIDTAPGRLLPDLSIVSAAKAQPATKGDLAKLREFTGRSSRTQLDRWWSAIESGVASQDLPPMRKPGEHIPPARAWADRNPQADLRLKGARKALAQLSEELKIPVENLLTPELLRNLAWQPPQMYTIETVSQILSTSGARSWQISATAQLIVDAFVDADQSEPESGEPVP